MKMANSRVYSIQTQGKVNLFVSEDKYGRKATIVPRSADFF